MLRLLFKDFIAFGKEKEKSRVYFLYTHILRGVNAFCRQPNPNLKKAIRFAFTVLQQKSGILPPTTTAASENCCKPTPCW